MDHGSQCWMGGIARTGGIARMGGIARIGGGSTRIGGGSTRIGGGSTRMRGGSTRMRGSAGLVTMVDFNARWLTARLDAESPERMCIEKFI
jgi:hypothetical protein